MTSTSDVEISEQDPGILMFKFLCKLEMRDLILGISKLYGLVDRMIGSIAISELLASSW